MRVLSPKMSRLHLFKETTVYLTNCPHRLDSTIELALLSLYIYTLRIIIYLLSLLEDDSRAIIFIF